MIASGFVGRAIVQSGQHVPVGKGYGAGRWKGLVVFTGVMMASASLGAVGLAKSRRREKGVGQVESGSESEE